MAATVGSEAQLRDIAGGCHVLGVGIQMNNWAMAPSPTVTYRLPCTTGKPFPCRHDIKKMQQESNSCDPVNVGFVT